MNKSVKLLASLLLLSPAILSLHGCGCGFDCNNSNSSDQGPAVLSLGFSDATPEDLKQVVIEVDSITFRRNGAEDIVVEQFTIDELNAVAADTFQVDLLRYLGRNQLLVITDFELEVGTYSEVKIVIVGDDINHSFVQEADDSLKPITAGASGLSAPGMTLPTGVQRFTVEFGLAQSLQFQSGSDSYLLASDGVRTQDSVESASLSGRVDSELFDTVSPCDQKTDPESGNRIYIYQGLATTANQLGDVFNSAGGTAVPEDVLAPFAVASLVDNALTGTWDYAFGYLPPGDYTLAFGCDTAEDDPVDFDNLVIPLPDNQVYEFTLSDSEQAVCDLSATADCNST